MYIYIYIYNLRSHRGFSVAFSNGFQWCFLFQRDSLVSGMFQRIITCPVDSYWKCPVDVQWHFPMEFHFLWVLVCNILPRSRLPRFQSPREMRAGLAHGAVPRLCCFPDCSSYWPGCRIQIQKKGKWELKKFVVGFQSKSLRSRNHDLPPHRGTFIQLRAPESGSVFWMLNFGTWRYKPRQKSKGAIPLIGGDGKETAG